MGAAGGIELARAVAIKGPMPVHQGSEERTERWGSGYLIAPDLVLTAQHCVKDGADGVRVLRASDAEPVVVREVVASSQSVDMAVIRLDAPLGKDDVVPPRFGRVDRTRTGVLDDCELIGFPEFQRDVPNSTRWHAEVHGAIYLTEGERQGRLVVRDSRLVDVTPPAGRGDPWAGMSGAVLFHRGVALGVVVEHHPQQGTVALQLTTFDAMFEPDKVADAAELAKELDIADIGGLVTASSEPDVTAGTPAESMPAEVLVLGDHVSGAVSSWQDRVKFRESLRKMLLTGQRNILSVTGRPGIGKSAVVAKVLAEFEQRDPARRKEEEPDAIVYLSPRTGVADLTAAHAYLTIATLAAPDEAEQLAERWNNMKLQALPDLWNALRQRSVVVVLDHLDELQNKDTFELTDPAMVEFLVSAGKTPHAPRVITTSRHRLKLPSQLVEPLELKNGLKPADGIALLRSYPDPNGVIGGETDERLAQVVEIIHGLPRGLDLIANILLGGEADDFDTVDEAGSAIEEDNFFIDTLLDSPEGPDELIKRLLSRNYDDLDDPGHRIVDLLALAGVPLPEPELLSLLADLDDTTAVRTTLHHLINRRVLGYDGQSRLVRLDPLDADWILKSLVHDHEGEQIQLDLRLADWYAAARTDPDTWRVPADVGPNVREYHHRWRAARQPAEYSAALIPLVEAARQLARMGDARTVFRAIEDAEGHVVDAPGLLYIEQCRFMAEFFGGSLERAEQAARTAVDRAADAALPSAAADARLWLGKVLRHRGDPAGSVPILGEVADNDNGSVSRETRIDALFELGLSLCYLGKWVDAEAAADRLASLVRPDDAGGFRAAEFDVRSLARLGSRDCEGAIAAATRAIEFYCDSSQQDNVGYLQNVRGLALMYSGDIGKAEHEFLDAADIGKKSGQGRVEGLCAINLAWCKMADAEWSEALEFASRAADCLTLVVAEEHSTAQELVSALSVENRGNKAKIFDALIAAIGSSRDNADLYSPDDAFIARVAEQLTERQ